MRPMTLRSGLMLIVVAALLPIGTLSVVQALANLRYAHTLIGNQLVTSALATASSENDSIIISKQILFSLSSSVRVRSGGAACHDTLKANLGSSPALLNLARSDATGRVLCSVLPFDPATSFAKDAWWQRGIKAKDFTVSAPVFGPISKRRILVGMLPLVAEDGSQDGAVTVAIDASWLERSLENSELAYGAEVAIVDQSGTVVLKGGASELPRFDVNAANMQVAEARSKDGTAWMYAVAPLYERELFVVYAEPTERLMATAVGQVRINLILPIITLLLASLAIWLGSNQLVLRWLDSLRTLAAQFAGGDYTGNPGRYERAPREVGLLSADLHRMAKAMETRDHALQAALDAKTALTHDIHHRVKNNLQIVSSLLSLQAGKISDLGARDALSQTRARIGALAQIHRLLYEESQDSDHGEVNIAKLLTALCTQLRTLHRGQSTIQLSCDVASLTVPINSAVPLTLLAVEAVTNAYRHGFPSGQSGMILIKFGLELGQVTLSVSDDGIGFDSAEAPASMGRQLMDAFAQQLGGVLNISSAPNSGTVVTLTYPLIEGQDLQV